MEYVATHLPAILLACVIVAAAAVLWWYSMELAAKRKRERVQALKHNAENAPQHRPDTDDK
ncbi:MAG: hypothetical protein MJ127_05200 [Mogibacterium sp.]|nr:hypothetical protein [Mogibacterium sp.]